MEIRVAVVTGASSGLGAALARRLADRGVAVGLTARRAEALATLAGEIKSRGGQAAIAPADAADPCATRDALTHLAEALGPVDLLIANAGMASANPTETFSAEAFDYLIRVNLLGAAYAFEAVLPEMLQRGRGHLVGVSSLAGYRACSRGHAGYSASKAALTTLLEGFRVELRGRGIAVTTVHPGFVRTPLTNGFQGPMPLLMELDRAADRMMDGILARRSRVDFPGPAAAAMSVVRWLPMGLYDRLFDRIFRASRRLDTNRNDTS